VHVDLLPNEIALSSLEIRLLEANHVHVLHGVTRLKSRRIYVSDVCRVPAPPPPCHAKIRDSQRTLQTTHCEANNEQDNNEKKKKRNKDNDEKVQRKDTCENGNDDDDRKTSDGNTRHVKQRLQNG